MRVYCSISSDIQLPSYPHILARAILNRFHLPSFVGVGFVLARSITFFFLSSSSPYLLQCHSFHISHISHISLHGSHDSIEIATTVQRQVAAEMHPAGACIRNVHVNLRYAVRSTPYY